MQNKIPYSSKGGGSHRPYIEIEFFNPDNKKVYKTFGIMDSGADLIFLDYSAGYALGFEQPSPEELELVSGIGGAMHTVKRSVTIYLAHHHEKKRYAFEHEVMWFVPDSSYLKEYVALVTELKELEKLRTQIAAQPGDNTANLISPDAQIAEKKKQITLKGDELNPGNLMGRDFFANFESVIFVQKDQHDQCSYEYTIHRSKVTETIELTF